MTRLISPANDAVIELHTYPQKIFAGAGSAATIDWLKLNRSEKDDCTQPLNVEFMWECDEPDAVFELSESPDFKNSTRICLKSDAASMNNLKSGQEYFWRVNGCSAFRFTTASAAPRWLNVEGLSNVRDMGAWQTEDGRRVKQGLIYRGSEMDTHHTITAAGIHTMKDVLGIRTDLDLRGEAVGKVFESPLGSDVNFVHIPAKAYSEFMDDDQKAVCRRLFEILADSTLYPIYFHCWGGADRTGTLALLLEAVLGLSEEDMLRDYELTSLSIWGDRSRDSELFKSLIAALDAYGTEAEGLREKALRYLHSCGISSATIEEIRRNLLI